MGTTLYILRQSLDRISSSIFQASDSDMDLVFVEQAASMVHSSVKGLVVATVDTEGVAIEHSHQTVTYDDLIEKVISSEHIIVV